ncbi:hypothetical protein F4776DRAFT_658144 [Hypoxylon sp. NC0597]|nr:hypothetical protein F4776DRAFT_658144 [Hypoxylon sp. NC0597]
MWSLQKGKRVIMGFLLKEHSTKLIHIRAQSSSKKDCRSDSFLSPPSTLRVDGPQPSRQTTSWASAHVLRTLILHAFPTPMSHVPMETNRQLQLAAGPSTFPKFSRFPEELQTMVWEHAVVEVKKNPGYVLLSGSVRILQKPPAMFYACRLSRRVLLEEGGGDFYALEDGSTTWFCEDTDFLLWGGFNLGLGELASAVQNVVLPRRMFEDYIVACETFEELLSDGEFDQLQNIYVNLENRFTFLKTDPRSVMRSKLFHSSTIVVPDLNWYDQTMEKIDHVYRLFTEDDEASWGLHREIAFDDDDQHEWKDFGGDVKFALVSTLARLDNNISEDDFDAFEREQLMHPSGISWFSFISEHSPDVWPTFVLTTITTRQRVEGVVGRDDLLGRILEDFE